MGGEGKELQRPGSCVWGAAQGSDHVPQTTSAGIKLVSQRLLWQNPGLLESPGGHSQGHAGS